MQSLESKSESLRKSVTITIPQQIKGDLKRIQEIEETITEKPVTISELVTEATRQYFKEQRVKPFVQNVRSQNKRCQLSFTMDEALLKKVKEEVKKYAKTGHSGYLGAVITQYVITYFGRENYTDLRYLYVSNQTH